MSRRTRSDANAPGISASPIITAVATSTARNPNGYMPRDVSPPMRKRTTHVSNAASPTAFLRWLCPNAGEIHPENGRWGRRTATRQPMSRAWRRVSVP